MSTAAERKRRERERQERHEIVIKYLVVRPPLVDLLLAIGRLKPHEIEDRAAVHRALDTMLIETSEAHVTRDTRRAGPGV